MNNEGITNIYIQFILSKYCPKYQGVYSSDSIPSKLAKLEEFGIVVNLSDADEKGTHFTAIISQKTHALYIDSYGKPCDDNDICKFLTKLGKPVFFNTRQIQSYESNFCGFFSMLYVLHYCNESTKPLRFSKQLMKNDDLCIQYLCRMLNKKRL